MQYALEFSYDFQLKIKDIFRGFGYNVSGDLKANLTRIAQKIKEDNTGPFRITDMIRALIIVDDVKQLVVAYETLIFTPGLKVIRIKNKL